MVNNSIGCFGKLPIYSDFIRLAASGKEIVMLDQWIQEGIYFAKSRMGQKWTEEFQKSDPCNFLYHTGDNGCFLIGVYVPGKDESGRSYPFLIFLRVEFAQFQLPIYFAPLYFSGFLNAARDMALNGWAGVDLKTYLSNIGQMKVSPSIELNSIKNDYLGKIGSCTANDFWRMLFNDSEDKRKYILLKNLTDIMRQLKNNSAAKFTIGLGFPLSIENKDEGIDIPFWFDLAFRLSGQGNRNPIFFWNRSPSAGSPYLLGFLNPPLPKSFLYLIRQDMDNDGWYKLAPDVTVTENELIKKIDMRQKELLDKVSISMAGLIEALAAC